MNDSLSKNDVKTAVKEVLNEERLTQNQLRKMIQEEIDKSKQKDEEIQKNSGLEAALESVPRHLFSPNWTVKWYLLQFILMCPVAIGLKMLLMVTDTLWTQFILNGSTNLKVLIFLLLLLLIIFLIVITICCLQVKIFDKINLYNHKFAKPIAIAVAIYWFGMCWPNIGFIEFLTNF